MALPLPRLLGLGSEHSEWFSRVEMGWERGMEGWDGWEGG